MNRVVVTSVAALVALLVGPQVLGAEVVESLRGKAITEADEAPTPQKQMIVKDGIARNFKKQPPLIPHTVDKYRVTLRENGCLKCHSEANYKKEKAPKAGDSHFVDRTGKKLTQISSARYFCEQCHVPQTDAPPLVDNTFEPLAASK